jgi:ribosomal protein S18 acetylase RimI-like enzyme
MTAVLNSLQSDNMVLRPARRQDAADIARLFLISSDGLAEYIWNRDRPAGVGLLAHGTARYARENTAFSYQNCMVVEAGGGVVAMLHAFEMPDTDGTEDDPVLKPYAKLEDPGSYYISGVAVDGAWRQHGIGSRLLDDAERRARQLGLPATSLICFEANQGACRLYEARGYRVIARRPLVAHPALHYEQGDALLMRCALSE